MDFKSQSAQSNMAERSISLTSDVDIGMEIEEADAPMRHGTRGRAEEFFWTQILSAEDFCDYVPNKFDIKQDIDYMNYHFAEWEGIPDH